MRGVLRVCVMLVIMCATGLAASAQVARIELHVFQSQTPTDKQFLTGDASAPAVTRSGQLRIPRPGTEKLPAVVLLHGSGGFGNNVDHWTRELGAAGVATFAIDSFTGRGITSTSTDQDRLSRLAMIVDAYRALELLAKHSRIDPDRIYTIGFSRGGGAAHYAALKRFYEMHSKTKAEFAGFIALYPTCNRIFKDATNVFDRPIRIFHGSADDYVPAAACRTLVARLQQAGKNAVLTEYPDAHHVYDNPHGPAPTWLPQVQTTRKCPPIEESEGGTLVNSATKQPFTYSNDPCVERGAHVGHNAHALAETAKAVKELVLRSPSPSK